MHSIMLQFKMSSNVATAPTATTRHNLVTVYRPGMFLPLRRAKSAMRSMYISLENEGLPLQLMTMRIRFVRCAISTVGNEHEPAAIDSGMP